MTFTPTAEQLAVKDAYLAGCNLVTDALAGSGKTTTLCECAKATPKTGAMYIAYNRAIRDDAEKSFPANALCRTAHALAMAAVGYQLADKLKGTRQRARDVAGILGIRRRLITVNVLGSPAAVDVPALARLTLDTIRRFCNSADYALTTRHVPRVTGLGDEGQAEVAAEVIQYAAAAWSDLCNPAGRIRLKHDHYLKLWHLTHPVIASDVIFLDEAQDADPVIASIVSSQSHAQLILVGDRHQQLYGWRGAKDAMTHFAGTRLALTKSFRFGPAIAAAANEWLAQLGSELRVVGHDPIPSTVGPLPLEQVSAILCRTNAGAIAEVLRAEDRGLKAALTGGAGELARLAEAAAELQCEGRTWHPELSEADADVVISTGHKAKGREWPSVRIADDFKPNPRRDPETGDLVEPEMTDEARMLAYVAVTRAQLHLDPAGLNWARETPTAIPSSGKSSGTAASATTPLEA